MQQIIFLFAILFVCKSDSSDSCQAQCSEKCAATCPGAEGQSNFSRNIFNNYFSIVVSNFGVYQISFIFLKKITLTL